VYVFGIVHADYLGIRAAASHLTGAGKIIRHTMIPSQGSLSTRLTQTTSGELIKLGASMSANATSHVLLDQLPNSWWTVRRSVLSSIKNSITIDSVPYCGNHHSTITHVATFYSSPVPMQSLPPDPDVSYNTADEWLSSCQLGHLPSSRSETTAKDIDIDESRIRPLDQRQTLRSDELSTALIRPELSAVSTPHAAVKAVGCV